MKMKIPQTIGAGVMSLGLVVGLAGFAGASRSTEIRDTGSRSNNVVRERSDQRVKVRNNNDIRANNHNNQDALTGNASSRDNTRSDEGGAWTGEAMNRNSTNASVQVDNSASSAAASNSAGGSGSSDDASSSIDTTGSRSDNRIVTEKKSTVNVRNNNDIHVTNTNEQIATSGDATVRDNTRGGSAQTGDASNTNSTTMNFRVSN